MAKLGISTGSSPNDGTGDSLIDGAVKVNSNFSEIYNTIGDGSTLAVPVTSIVAGSNISVGGSTGNITITGLANTANVTTNSLVVTGISTLGTTVVTSLEVPLISTGVNVTGIITASSFVGDGSLLTNLPGGSGITTANISADTLQVSGFSTFTGVSTFNGATNFNNDITVTGDINSTNLNISDTGLTLGNSISPYSQFDISWSPSTGRSPAIRYKIGNGISIYNRYNGGAELREDVRFGSNTKFKNISPFSDSDYDLGTDSLRWAAVYSDEFHGGGSALTGIVTSLVAGSNVSISSSGGTYTINSSGGGGGSGITTANISADTLVVSGVSTLASVTVTSISGNGSGLTGLGTFSGNYNDLSNQPTIPTNNNQLTNGAGFITTSFTDTDQLTNGAGFITNVVSGVLTATSFSGGGSRLTGIVTSLVAGSNVTISNSGGTYTINSSGGGGGGGGGTASQTQTGVALTSVSNIGLALTTGTNADISMIGNHPAGTGYASAANQNPSVSWDFNTTSLPTGVSVTSYSVLLEDLRAVDGGGVDPFIHWSVSGIPNTITSIPANAGTGDITDATINNNTWMAVYSQPANGINGVSVVGYSGPQPPTNDNHIYRLSVTAQLSGDSTGTLTESIEFNFDTTNTLTTTPTPTPTTTDNLTFTYTTSGGGSSGITTANISADTLVVSGVSTLGIATGATYYGDASYITTGRWVLGANGSTDYTFTGPGFSGAVADPVLYLARGQTYEFVNVMGAHPFQIRASNGGAPYNTGVTNNNTSNGTVRFEIPMDAPNTLYYQCTSHAGMGNTISVYPNTI